MRLQSILSHLSHPLSLSKTTQLHASILTSGLSHDPFFATNLIRLYSIAGKLESARLIFDQTFERTVYLWNAIIRAYAKNQQVNHAFSLYIQMQASETKPDGHTFACILRLCSENSDCCRLKITHKHLISAGFQQEMIPSSALISGYAKMGLIQSSRKVFDQIPERDLVMWNAMINGYFQCGLYETGITLFITMVNWGIRPDGFSLVAVSSCFIDESSLKQGQEIHGFALKTVLNEEKQNQHVISGLVAMYTRCNCLDYGIKMFNQVLHPDLITWSALLCGLFQFGDCENGVKLFRNLIFSGITPDPILISAMLSSCAKCAMLRWGKETHGYIFRCNFKDSGEISSALINMYSRCGSIKWAHQIFETVSRGNLVVYNSMIAGLAAHGLGLEAIQLFDELVGRGLRPDGATFAGLLSACRHSGLVDEGQEIFEKMRGIFGIFPGVEHYVYMVELLGLAGKLEEAYFLVEERPASGVWGAFLSLCRDHSDVALARVAAERLLELEPRKVAYRVIMSNIYASEGRWEEVRKVREEMAEREMRKTPGCSWILQ